MTRAADARYVARCSALRAAICDFPKMMATSRALRLAQLPIIVLFAATQLPRDSAWALRVLALRVAAALAVIAPVFLLNL